MTEKSNAIVRPAPAAVCLSLVPGTMALMAVPPLGEMTSPMAGAAMAVMGLGAALSALPSIRSGTPIFRALSSGDGLHPRGGWLVPRLVQGLCRIRPLLARHRGMLAG
ncbi:hypothetical protein [Roseomonas indoligenes]|uniref:Uncharacterized protein n=1 Tax=Roseomonas indoligenes TaxID=2820811 RepID=A0A940N4H2_9PROT|nr:hypothetical protein [Pararoseomonas indoligenes]MBP0496449.1 hypothetical protein [Pararoseomonas indoligenes]